MSDLGAATRRDGLTGRQTTATGWVGWVFFAGVMMVMLGIFQAIEGLVAIFNDKYFLVGKSGLVISADYTVWGWVHLLIGIIVAIAGYAVIRGQMWGRVIGIIGAGVSAVVNLGFLAAYPIWGTIIITIDIIVIYALIVHGREVQAYDA